MSKNISKKERVEMRFSLRPPRLEGENSEAPAFSEIKETQGIHKVFNNWPLEGEAGLSQIRFFFGAPKPQGEKFDALAFL